MRSMTRSRRGYLMAALTVGFFLSSHVCSSAQDTAPALAKDNADIVALLDQEKQDPEKLAALAAEAYRDIPSNLADPERGEAYFHRAQAHRIAAAEF